jgi:hypothetical protein
LWEDEVKPRPNDQDGSEEECAEVVVVVPHPAALMWSLLLTLKESQATAL